MTPESRNRSTVGLDPGQLERLAAPRLPDRWEVIRRLGSGGQAVVWLARDLLLGEVVALKVFPRELPADSLRRLRREVTIGRELRHPNLVRVYELVETPSGPALAMGYCEGGSLISRLGDEGLQIPQVIAVAESLLEALSCLHAERVVHRDVKPSNVLLGSEGQVLLGDLGLARELEPGPDATRTRGSVGTPRYMSPEQLRGAEVGFASDLYSLGATLYQLLTGEPPFVGETDFDVADAHLHKQPEDPRQVRQETPRWLARFVLRLLEKSPGDRWPDAAAALHAFRRRRFSLSPARRRRWVQRAAVVMVVAAGIGLAFSVVRERVERPAAAVSVVADGNVVRALDGQGRVVWQHTMGTTVRQVEQADLDGDGRKEVIVGTAVANDNTARSEDSPPAEAAVFDARGKLLSLLHPEKVVAAGPGSQLPPPLLLPQLVLLDLDGDGRRELFLNCHHRVMGNAYLFLYDPGQRQWRLVLNHTQGWIFDLTPVPGAVPPRLRLYAVNATLGELPVIGQLMIQAPVPGADQGAGSGIAGLQASGGATLEWYTPLPQTSPGPLDAEPPFVCDAAGFSPYSFRGHVGGIDRWGNPVPGPNAGRDLAAARLAILRDLSSWNPMRFADSANRLLARRQELEARYPDLLREAPYREVIALYTARMLGASGAPRRAVELLRPEYRKTGDDSVGLALAQLQAVTGDYTAALNNLVKVTEHSVSSAGWYGANVLSFRIAMELGDDALLERLLPASRSFVARPELLDVVRAEARLWWDRCRPSDGKTRSYDLTPEGEAVGLLARWRLGTLGPDAVPEAEAALKRNPDAAWEGLVALAMAREQAGDHAGAFDDLEKARSYVDADRGLTLRSVRGERLVGACRARVLADSGRLADAAALARRVVKEAPSYTLPAIVAREVLDKTGQPTNALPR